VKSENYFLTGAAAAILVCAAFAAQAADTAQSGNGGTIAAKATQQIAKIVPGESTRSDVQALLGAPWRIVQFNDCGMAMHDQADETWEYRGADPSGGYRLHVEFGDNKVVHLIAKIPDATPGGKATEAKVGPEEPTKGMSM
jgi:hypothetical protein